ncbi:MAG TPA: hypothetical protein VFK00_08100 [Rhodanobacteraceae bacterium]|jgi:hypothetical protein|nr:hypothetical protein [Rhodanobacteraceae bacterium]
MSASTQLRWKAAAFGAAIGIALGAGNGVVFGNIPLGAGAGLVLGVGLGLVIGSLRAKRRA